MERGLELPRPADRAEAQPAQRGLQTQAAYTWSKSIDTGSSISSVSSGTGYESSFAVATPLLPELGRGLSNYDVRHNFVGSFVWEMPFVGVGSRA